MKMKKMYKTDLLGKRYEVQQDEETVGHEPYCYLFVIPFNDRTRHSCNCPNKGDFKNNFDKRRTNGQQDKD